MTIEHDVYVVPTQYLWRNLYGAPDAGAMLMQPEMRYVSPETRDGWRRRAEGGGSGPPDEVALYLELRDRILKALSDAGAGILMGTDSPQLFNVPGFALHRELAVMSEAGMSNYEILKSGTVTVGELRGPRTWVSTATSGRLRADSVPTWCCLARARWTNWPTCSTGWA